MSLDAGQLIKRFYFATFLTVLLSVFKLLVVIFVNLSK